MSDAAVPERVYGIDFSGSQEAGESIWIAEGAIDDGLHVVDCRSAADRLDAPTARNQVYPALTGFLADLSPATVVGLDFPFGLPAALVSQEEWQQFLLAFPGRFDSPADLRRRCTRQARLLGHDKQLRRATDEPLGALSPYDLRLQNQTFYGIRDLLRPLVLSGAVTVQPMQAPSPSAPSLLEVYPAGTLADLGLHRGQYKNGGEQARERRASNLEGVLEAGVAVEPGVREAVVDQAPGDALDSVVAAFAAYRNTVESGLSTDWTDERTVEGHIYV